MTTTTIEAITAPARASFSFVRRLATILSAAAFVASGALVPAQAQAPATGEISGRVINAANGRYLPNARVAIVGTNIETFTNPAGEYTLRNVPAGTADVRVFFTGQEPQSSPVAVEAGKTSVKYFAFNSASEITSDTPIELNEYEVEASRFSTAQELAINEERVSVNIKNVVSADAFGEIPSGNIGEFIKFLPGVELDYGGTYVAPTDASGISIRGFGAADTAIYIDGVPVAAASQGSLTNQVELDMLSINNASRVELIKVPTPDMPMNSVGGQINLISKSAFEYSKPSFTWRAYMTVNSENPNPFKKVAGPEPKKVLAGQPGFELSYINPVNEKFGFSVTASMYNQFSANRRLRPEWGTANVNLDLRPFGGERNTPATNAVGPVSLANPYMTRVTIIDAPRTSSTLSASLKGDWKPFDGLALTGTYQISTYESADAARRIQIRTQSPQSWDATSTISYAYLPASQSANGSAFTPANTSLAMDVDARDKEGTTHTGSLRAIYRKGPWDVFALASASTSRASFKDFENGHLSKVELSRTIGQVRFEDISGGVPGEITVLDRDGNVLDFTKLSNWNAPSIQAFSGKAESMDDKFNYKLDVKRDLDFLPWREVVRLSFKTGFLREETLKKKWGLGTGYRERYVGPSLALDTYLDNTYLDQDPGFGFAPQQWPSVYALYDYYQANPELFQITEADARENWFSYVGQNKRIKEVSDAWYAMLEGSAMKNRLNFVIGLRDETRTRTGAGPRVDGRWNFVKNADGTLYRNSTLLGGNGLVRIDQANSPLFATNATGDALRADLTSQGIAFPNAVIVNNSLAQAMLQRRALQEVYGKSSGDPSYSVNVAYDITEKLVGKVAFSRTFGRIPLEDGTAGLLTGGTSFNITEAEDPTAIPRGTIAVANPNLLPEISTNWDYALTYYTSTGGKFGVSYYTKDIENFSDSIQVQSGVPEFDAMMASLGLNPADYADWRITTSQNGIGTGKVSGYEVEAAQDLRVFGDWGRRVNFFGSYSKNNRKETNTTRISARPAASQLATGGLNVSFNRFRFNIKGTWRDLVYVRGQGTFSIDGQQVQLGEYIPSTLKVDAGIDWQFSEKYSFYVSGRDVFNSGSEVIRKDLAGYYPTYAHPDDYREFGVQVTFGIRGRF
ncbi:hypothetical protein ASA1KI_20760 [Opitutales bacterium ASA1]|uniref:carboxypeptidase regulatory-like domain-containing protein n=1 Tax=Congregicoccus parvus TaxID=3081749 RepID=UPI002B2D6999|nr:hypothetical protein ASA1KI_20760 [Opitutales bacterium ASA1]